MDNLFRLVKAIFFLVLAILMLVLAGLFQSTVIAAIGVYGAFFLGLIGIGTGAFAIIDHKKEQEETGE